MCDKMATSAYTLKIIEKDPFLRLQMRAKEIRLRKYQCHLKISFPRENEAIKHDLVEFKVQCLKVLLPWQQIYHLPFLFNF